MGDDGDDLRLREVADVAAHNCQIRFPRREGICCPQCTVSLDEVEAHGRIGLREFAGDGGYQPARLAISRADRDG